MSAAPHRAPHRRGQGVVQGAHYSAELLAAVAAAGAGPKMGDIFSPGADAGSPRSIVGGTAWHRSNSGGVSGTCSGRTSFSTDVAPGQISRASFDSHPPASVAWQTVESGRDRMESIGSAAACSLEAAAVLKTCGVRAERAALALAAANSGRAATSAKHKQCTRAAHPRSSRHASSDSDDSSATACVDRVSSPVSDADSAVFAARRRPRRGQGVVRTQRLSPHALAAVAEWRIGIGEAPAVSTPFATCVSVADGLPPVKPAPQLTREACPPAAASLLGWVRGSS